MEIKEFETKVIDIIQRTHDIKSFGFAIPEKIHFKPGQYFVLKIPGVKGKLLYCQKNQTYTDIFCTQFQYKMT